MADEQAQEPQSQEQPQSQAQPQMTAEEYLRRLAVSAAQQATRAMFDQEMPKVEERIVNNLVQAIQSQQAAAPPPPQAPPPPTVNGNAPMPGYPGQPVPNGVAPRPNAGMALANGLQADPFGFFTSLANLVFDGIIKIVEVSGRNKAAAQNPFLVVDTVFRQYPQLRNVYAVDPFGQQSQHMYAKFYESGWQAARKALESTGSIGGGAPGSPDPHSPLGPTAPPSDSIGAWPGMPAYEPPSGPPSNGYGPAHPPMSPAPTSVDMARASGRGRVKRLREFAR